MPRVTIFHNTARDEHGHAIGFDGYQPGQPVVPVFAYDVEFLDGGVPELLLIAEQAFEMFNVDLDMLTGRKRELATQYRHNMLRSLSFPGNRPCCPRSCCTRRSVVWLSPTPRRKAR